MAIDTIPSETQAGGDGNRDKLIGVFIGVLALVLAVCGVGGGNATQEATLKNIEASNTWAFFQAKNARRQAYRLHADDFTVMLAADPSMPEEAKAKISEKIKSYAEQDKKLTSDPQTNEGLDELWAKAKALETARDEALKRGPYFDYGQALLQIAIVLASIAIISGGSMLLLAGSAFVGLIGVVATVGGFTLAFPLPF